MIRAMLSLDLKGASDPQRTDFNEHLSKSNWLKLKDVDTVWCRNFSGIVDDEDGFKRVRDTIANVIKAAAKETELLRVTYVVQVANREAIGRIVKKGKDGYDLYHYNPYPDPDE